MNEISLYLFKKRGFIYFYDSTASYITNYCHDRRCFHHLLSFQMMSFTVGYYVDQKYGHATTVMTIISNVGCS